MFEQYKYFPDGNPPADRILVVTFTLKVLMRSQEVLWCNDKCNIAHDVKSLSCSQITPLFVRMPFLIMLLTFVVGVVWYRCI